jgi:hypothetical protein
LQNNTPRDTLNARRLRHRLSRHFGEDGGFTPPYVSEEGKEARERLLPKLLDTFTLSKNNSGVLPLVTRMIQNSPTKGIASVRIEDIGEEALAFSFTEGEHTYRLRAGLATFLPDVLEIHGEFYRIASAYTFGLDAERTPFFKLEIRFSEMASARRLVIRPQDGGLAMLLSEQPGYLLIERLSRAMPLEDNAILNLLVKTKTPVEWALKHARRAFFPTVSLTPVKSEGETDKKDV